MEFTFNMPTRIFFGRGAIEKNAQALALGKRAFLVTGKSSGRLSGALGDVQRALTALGIEHEAFEGIGNNPNVEQCREIGALARAFKADFVVGIGGGSPLDAAKAVAVFGAEDIAVEDLFQNKYERVLPILAVPTTSGTGSEVTPWSIMTWDKIRTKLSFGGPRTFPRAAFLDPSYTDALPYAITLDTAIDAFTHCFESVLSQNASALSDAVNFMALSRFSKIMGPLEKGELSAIRAELMLVSMLAGLGIANTGTTLMHGMGYPLTYFKNVPHGRANAFVLPAYLKAVRQYRPERLDAALGALSVSEAELTSYIRRLFPVDISLEKSELDLFAEQTIAKNPQKTTGIPNDASYVRALYELVFCG